MSRIGRKDIDIPDGIEVKVQADSVSLEGSKGKLSVKKFDDMDIKVEGKKISVLPSKSLKDKKVRALWGLQVALLISAVKGLSVGFKKELIMKGVGYKAAVQGDKLNLNLGYSHPINYKIPEGIKIECPNPTTVLVSGIDAQKVGQVAADIRFYRMPEPYLGKGIKYSDEVILRKQGKK